MGQPTARDLVSTDPIAERVRPLIDLVLAPEANVEIQFWDGSTLTRGEPVGSLIFRSPRAFRHIAWSPGELGLARAFVSGDLDIAGDVIDLVMQLRTSHPQRANLARAVPKLLRTLWDLQIVGPRPPLPDAEYRPGLWGAHSPWRDSEAISHHYDVSNEFYELVLGPSMTYSCAYFPDPSTDLTAAQEAKHELISLKLGLHERPMRLLDVGCGWGSMAMHAAATHGAQVVGITISREQAQYARKRVADAGLTDKVEIRLQDYRDLGGETFDVISSVGMSEHVGKSNLRTYFSSLRDSLEPHGRLLNHAISSIGGSRLPRSGFIYRYVFPDGELIDLGESIRAMQDAGFEIRDVQSLREHYHHTLRNWVSNLERHWDEAVALAGEERARTWRLYMAASAVGFADAGINIHQVLGVVNDDEGTSGMPRTRPV